MIKNVSRALKAAVDFVMPIACVNCGTEGSFLCDSCMANAPKLPNNTCMKCAEHTAEHVRLCGECATLPPPLDRLVPIYRYGGPVRSAVHALKYRHITAIAPTMSKLMSQSTFTSRAKLDCVAPTPMHADRLHERGYNQAALLAQNVAENLQLRYIEDALAKIRSTPSQVELTRQERAFSLRNAFAANYDFDNAHVLLIDDVCTTGNTLMNCAAALKRAGARRVSAVVFAKELMSSESTDETL